MATDSINTCEKCGKLYDFEDDYKCPYCPLLKKISDLEATIERHIPMSKFTRRKKPKNDEFE